MMSRILVVRFSSLGDLVTLEPTFRAFRYFFKDSHIDFLTTGIGKGLYEDSGYFDGFVLHNSIKNSIKQLKDKRYDIIFNLQCNKPSHIITLFVKKDQLVNKSYTMFQKFFGLKADEYDIKKMLKVAGIQDKDIESYFKDGHNLQIDLPCKKDLDIQETIKKKFKDKHIVALAPGASQRWSSKKWGRDNFLKLSLMLRDEYGVVLVGSSLEKEDASYICDNNKDVLNMVDKTSLMKLKSLIKNVDIFVGNDSGPIHIAAALKVSTITIFGSTSKKHCPKMIYKDKEHFCITPSSNISCHPCYKSKCPTNLECMQDIKPKRVYDIIQKYFKEKNEAS